MDLPGDVAQKMRRSCLLVLGAGVFSPSLQIVFSSLLRGALEYKDDNDNRFMIHNQAARVKDPLHRAEAALLSKSQPADRRKFDVWLLRTYGLQLRLFPPLALLAYLDHQLNENYSGATQA